MHATSVVLALSLCGVVVVPTFAAPIAPNVEGRSVALADAGEALAKGLLTGGGLAAVTATVEHFVDGDKTSRKRTLSDDDVELLKQELAARGVALADAAEALGKGLLTGGGLAAVTAAAEHFIDSDKPSQKRALSADDVELLKRELDTRGVALADAGEALGKGLLTGGGLAALTAEIEHLVGKSNSTTRDVSDIEKRQLGAVIGKLAGATDAALGDVVKNGAVAGAAFGTAEASSDSIINKIFREREIEERSFASAIAKPVAGSLAGGVVGLGVTEGLKEVKDLIDGNSSSPQRRQVAAAAAKVAEDTLGDVIKKGVIGGLGSAVGGSVIGDVIDKIEGKSKREIEDRSFASAIAKPVAGSLAGGVVGLGVTEGLKEIKDLIDGNSSSPQRRQVAAAAAKVAEDTLGDVIKKGLIGGVGSAVGGSVIGDVIDKIEGKSTQKREPVNLGPIAKGLVGTGVGLAASTAAEGVVDKIESIFRRDLSDDEVDQVIQLLGSRRARTLSDLD